METRFALRASMVALAATAVSCGITTFVILTSIADICRNKGMGFWRTPIGALLGQHL